MKFEDVLADAAERVTHLKLEGHPVQAASLERLTDEVRSSLREFTTWLDEKAAKLYSNRSAEYLRIRFPAWQARGLAEWRGKVRYYRQCCLEHRGNADAARQAGRRAARGETAA
jgi:hypothetical protein